MAALKQSRAQHPRRSIMKITTPVASATNGGNPNTHAIIAPSLVAGLDRWTIDAAIAPRSISSRFAIGEYMIAMESAPQLRSREARKIATMKSPRGKMANRAVNVRSILRPLRLSSALESVSIWSEGFSNEWMALDNLQKVIRF